MNTKTATTSFEQTMPVQQDNCVLDLQRCLMLKITHTTCGPKAHISTHKCTYVYGLTYRYSHR